MIFPLNMVIFYSSVRLPEGILFAMVPLQSLFKHRVPGSSQLGGDCIQEVHHGGFFARWVFCNLHVCCFPELNINTYAEKE